MAVKTCPKCKLISDPSAQLCDCGYEFATGTVRRRQPISKSGAIGPSERVAVAEAGDRCRSLFVWVGLQMLVGVGGRVLHWSVTRQSPPGTAAVLSLLILASTLAVAIVVARTALLAAQAIGLENPSAWAAGLFFGGIIGLAVMSSHMRRWCEQYGIRFGLLGPNLEDLNRIAAGSTA